MLVSVLRVLTVLAVIVQFHLCGESVAALSMTVNNSNLSSLVQSIARSEALPLPVRKRCKEPYRYALMKQAVLPQ